jgi:hypothetical protein
MAALLEAADARMAERTQRLKGVTRLHVPTPGGPLVVVIVAEMAALTAHCPDRKIKDRIKAALGHDSTRAAMIYLHTAHRANRAITDGLPVELRKRPDDEDGAAGVIVPVG